MCAIHLQGTVHIVVAGHDELTTHFVKFMPAHRTSAVRRVGIGANPDAELVVILEAASSK